jgi:GDP-L-fucose synthase
MDVISNKVSAKIYLRVGMKVLVTGSTGFLGKFLSAELKRRDYFVVETNSKNANLLYEEGLKAWNHEKFDQIYHLAAWTQAGDFCLKHPGEQWINNQKINTNILSWWSAHQKEAKLIFMGTSCSYDSRLPLSEEFYLQGEPIDSLYTYAMTKRMLLCGAMALQKQFSMNYLCVVPSTLYGPDYHLDGRQMHFIFDLVRKMIQAKLFGDEIVLWGDGTQVRELIHVSDFVNALITLGEKENNSVVNIGAGTGHTIKEFAQIIGDILEISSEKIFFDTSKYVGSKHKVLLIEKLMKIMPEFSPRPLKAGLNDTINWFLQNLDRLIPIGCKW